MSDDDFDIVLASALTLYLGLSGPARRSARYVLASGTPESRDALLEGCGRAIAAAGDRALAAQLAARGRTMGLAGETASEDTIDKEAVQAVQDARRARREALREEQPPPHGMRG